MNRSVLALGCGIVFAVFLLDLAGAFQLFDAKTQDLQQQHVSRTPVPMSDEILHVDIDDGALQRIGRWPWTRTLIAGCIDALTDAGARTIAIDLEFSEPAPDPGHDQRLAESLGANTILAALMQFDDVQQQWADSGGSAQGLAAIQTRLANDINLDPAEHGVELEEADQDAFAANEISLKRHVLWANPEQSSPTGFAERALQRAYMRQKQAEAIAIDRGLLDDANSADGTPMDRLPLPALMPHVGGLGYVNISRRGRDGVVRSIEPTQSMRSGSLTSLGAAAALHFLGERQPHAASLAADGGVLSISNLRQLPMHDGALHLAWPYTEHGSGWQHLMRNDTDDQAGAGHISIATIAELVEARQLQEANRSELAAISIDLLRVIRQDPNLQPEDSLQKQFQNEIADEYDFTLGDLDPGLDPAQVIKDPDALAHAKLLVAWHDLSEAIASNATEINDVQNLLHEKVNDKLVFIGWTATGSIADFVPTVAGPRTPGVVVHAAVANMMLTGHSYEHAPRWLGPLLVLILGLWITLLVASTAPMIATVCSCAILAIYVYLSAMLSFASWDLFLPVIAPVTSGASAWAACTGLSAVLIQRDKRRITRQFRSRVSDRLVDTLIDNPAAISMAGEQREITVLFADLAGFTSISEQLGSEQTVALANRTLAALSAAIVAHDGYVNKFLGDGLMAFWSAFEPQPDQAKLACNAANACRTAMHELNTTTQTPLALRIGIATGTAIVGDCGAPPELNDYTAIGDTVNRAARLESANKQFGTSTLIDGTTCTQAGGGFRVLPIGPTAVVGQRVACPLHAIVDTDFTDADVAAAEQLQHAVTSGDRAAARTALEAMGDCTSLDSIAILWANAIDGSGELVLKLDSK
ncbi:MAG: adenylate/guanylate cyclase domain-containing protein [Phycisphaerales bacterium]|nr:adenylate/guanylate cyclase domain-containing protein [Phycisphaerales bacterium]